MHGHLDLDLLSLGHAEIFVEFDGPAVNLAVDRLGHYQYSYSCSPFILRRLQES
jgi:hypothetical protein